MEERRRDLYAELRALVHAQQAAGAYDCCIQEPCSWCALQTGHCACGEGLRRGDPVCDECVMFWDRGLGAEAVDPASVRSFTEEQRRRSGRLCGEISDPAR